MRPRLVLALSVLCGGTAFAPAPFPRLRPDPAMLDLGRLQGTWKIVSLEQIEGGGRRSPIRWGVTARGVSHIRIRNSRWTYLEVMPGGVHENTSYEIAVNSRPKPATISFRFPAAPRAASAGLIRRVGDRVEVLWFATLRLPGSFEAPPVGHWSMLLERGK